MRQKELYAAPETQVLELRLEGVIATSEINSSVTINALGTNAGYDYEQDW